MRRRERSAARRGDAGAQREAAGARQEAWTELAEAKEAAAAAATRVQQLQRTLGRAEARVSAADLSSHLLQADLGGAQSGLAVAQADNVFLASTVRRLVKAGHGGSLSRHRLNEALRIVQRVEAVDHRAAEASRGRTPLSGGSGEPTPRERSASGGGAPIEPILVPPMEDDEERARQSATPASVTPAEAPVRKWSSIREEEAEGEGAEDQGGREEPGNSAAGAAAGEQWGGKGHRVAAAGAEGRTGATRPAPVRAPLAGFGSTHASTAGPERKRPSRLSLDAVPSGAAPFSAAAGAGGEGEGPQTDPRRSRARGRDPAPLRRLQSAVPTGSRREEESSARLRRSLAQRVRAAGATLTTLQRQRAKRTQSQADLLAGSDGAKGVAGSGTDSAGLESER